MRRPREAELLDEDRQGVSVKLGVEQERRLQRVEPVAGERRDLGAPGRLAEMVPVEGGVVGHQQGVAGELLQAGQRRGGGRSPVEVCVGDAGQPRDEERDRDPGVHQRREPGRDGEVLVQPHGADVDDAVVPRVEAGGLRVDDHELGAAAGHGPRITEGAPGEDARPPPDGDVAARPPSAPASSGRRPAAFVSLVPRG